MAFCVGLGLTGLISGVTFANEAMGLESGLSAAMVEAGPGATHTRCDQCHALDPLFSHPTGITPRHALPERFPLHQGEMTCQTCHTDDASREHGAGSGFMLRSQLDGTAFCQECHTPSGGRDVARVHASGLDRAHLDRGNRRSPSLSQFREAALDAESTQCVSCHDGTFGPDAGNHSARARFGEPDLRSDHPIGVSYRSKRSSASDLRLVDLARLDDRVRLFDANLGCGSCHSPYSDRPDLLVMSNQRSQLCMTCHVQ